MTQIHTTTLIVGTGFSGIGTAIALARRNRKAGAGSEFLIIEKADDVGGTWRENVYPGCACDIPSHVYSLSFAPNPGWTRMWSGQREILDYLRDLVERHDLRRRIHFGVAMVGARWVAAQNHWVVTTRSGDDGSVHKYVAQFLVLGVGALHIPNVPDFAGRDTFEGPAFHTAAWPRAPKGRSIDLFGKRVAVIGTGASAIQVIPAIVDEVAQLQVYQRTPPWVGPRGNAPLTPWLRRLLMRVPLARKVFRTALFTMYESVALGFNGHPRLLQWLEDRARANLERTVHDPQLRAALTPDYRIGCKRILGSGDYYPALVRNHVDVLTDAIAEITPRGIRTADGTERDVDVIVYATGFQVANGYARLNISGIDGRNLVGEWATAGAQANLGVTVSGFPNLFLLLGPNTGLGHNSVLFMVEQQIRHVLQAISHVERSGAGAIDVRAAVQQRYQRDIGRKLTGGIWSTGGCTSWYLDATGVNRTMWPGSTLTYWRRLRRLRAADFTLLPASAETVSGVRR